MANLNIIQSAHKFHRRVDDKNKNNNEEMKCGGNIIARLCLCLRATTENGFESDFFFASTLLVYFLSNDHFLNTSSHGLSHYSFPVPLNLLCRYSYATSTPSMPSSSHPSTSSFVISIALLPPDTKWPLCSNFYFSHHVFICLQH